MRTTKCDERIGSRGPIDSFSPTSIELSASYHINSYYKIDIECFEYDPCQRKVGHSWVTNRPQNALLYIAKVLSRWSARRESVQKVESAAEFVISRVTVAQRGARYKIYCLLLLLFVFFEAFVHLGALKFKF